MNLITSILERYPALVIDGALATELERRGCDLHDELWSARILLEQPEAIKQVHLDYFHAGADCAITASYQATLEGFRKRGLNEGAAKALIQKSVKLAMQARDEFWSHEANRRARPKPFVAASVGPYGAFLADGSEYRGEYGLTEKELMDFHRPRMKALVEAGADILACETIPCLIEAQALARLLMEFPNITAWISFSGRDQKHISEGQLFVDCVRKLEAHPQIASIGINCTSPEYISSLIRAAKKVTEKPILVYPNSGETYDSERNDWSGASILDSFGQAARGWYQAGARLVGGCCRTTPEDIRAIASWARAPRSRFPLPQHLVAELLGFRTHAYQGGKLGGKQGIGVGALVILERAPVGHDGDMLAGALRPDRSLVRNEAGKPEDLSRDEAARVAAVGAAHDVAHLADGELDVLHERQRPEAADPPIERPRDQQPLVAIRQRQEATAQPGQALDAARGRVRVVEGEPEDGGPFRVAGVGGEADRQVVVVVGARVAQGARDRDGAGRIGRDENAYDR